VSGKWLAVSSSWDGTLKVWDLKNGLELRTLVGHNQRVNSVIVTHHEDLIISISAKTQGFEARFSQNLAPVSLVKPQNPYLAYISHLFSKP